MKKNKLMFVLVPLVVVGFILRVWNLGSNPPELFSDEISGFVSAKSIIETGKDINGKLGVYFYNRLELYPPVYGYLSYISSIFIKNPILAIRLPAAVSGTLAIIAIYFLSEVFFKNKFVSFFSAFFYTFIPWSIHFARIGWSPALLVISLSTPIILFKLFIYHNKKYLFYLSCILFAISIYTYRALEFLAPVFLATLIIVFWKHLKSHLKTLLWGLTIFIILVAPCVYVSVTDPLMNGRAERISTFADGVNTKSVKIFVTNYAAHFNPDFLFITGDPNLRQNAGTGELFWIMLPLIIIGIYVIFKNISKPESKIFIFWLLIYPLGGSLTNDGVPHATRTLIGAPLFTTLCALGLYFISSKFPKFSKIITITTLTIFLLEFINFLPIYFLEYPQKSLSWWEYGQKQIFNIIKVDGTKLDRACLSNLNYWNEETLTKFYLPDSSIKIIDKVEDPECSKPKTLEVVTVNKLPTGNNFRLIDVIPDLEGKPYWSIYSNTE